MSVEVAIWRIDGKRVEPVSLSGVDYEQRLQEIIANDISIVDPSLMVIGREVSISHVGRIDILAIDADGNLIVVELKRNRTPRDVVAQILEYGYGIRSMASDQIAEIFIEYQKRYSSDKTPIGIDEAMRKRFDSSPDELNTSHRMVIVAGELDSSTERIVSYLREEYEVDINVVFFRAFQDQDRQYMTRAWLDEQDLLLPDKPFPDMTEWNRELYVSFGEGIHRRWNDAKKYGFVSAGGGEWYVRTLRSLQPGDRVWVNVPRKGYVGVGKVLSPAVRFDQFKANVNGSYVSLTDVDEIEAPQAFDEMHGEHFVGIVWTHTVDLEDAVRERGFFGNQNTVSRPTSAKWNFTIERLKTLWGVDQ